MFKFQNTTYQDYTEPFTRVGVKNIKSTTQIHPAEMTLSLRYETVHLYLVSSFSRTVSSLTEHFQMCCFLMHLIISLCLHPQELIYQNAGGVVTVLWVLNPHLQFWQCIQVFEKQVNVLWQYMFWNFLWKCKTTNDFILKAIAKLLQEAINKRRQ